MNAKANVGRKFRSSFTYNNWMFAKLGDIAENLVGTTWEELIQKFYFDPLGMTDSFTMTPQAGNPDNLAFYPPQLLPNDYRLDANYFFK